jgi:hypothetical protein
MRVQRRRDGRSWVHVYSTTVTVPGYTDRVVTIEVSRLDPDHPRVFANGPTDSPHRYPERGWRRLCMWYPLDPPEQRWLPDDGLLALFGMAAQHLFREAWWREHARWLGVEAPHGPPPTPGDASPRTYEETA